MRRPAVELCPRYDSSGCLMGLLRTMMPPKFQLLAILAFGVSMLFIENQIQKLEESRARLGKTKTKVFTTYSPICPTAGKSAVLQQQVDS